MRRQVRQIARAGPTMTAHVEPLPLPPPRPPPPPPSAPQSNVVARTAAAAAAFEATPAEAGATLLHVVTRDPATGELLGCAARLGSGPRAQPPPSAVLALLGTTIQSAILQPRRDAAAADPPANAEQLLTLAANDDDALHQPPYAVLTGRADVSAASVGSPSRADDAALAASLVAAQTLRSAAEPASGTTLGGFLAERVNAQGGSSASQQMLCRL